MDQISERQPCGSVSRLIPGLREGDRRAMQTLWERYFQPLIRLARSRMSRGRRAAGSEDIALEAFLDFCARLASPEAEERFPLLQTREHLWKLLTCFTIRTAFDFNQKQRRREKVVRGESALGPAGLAPFAGAEPALEFSAAVGELLDRLQDESLRAVALWRMEGFTVAEIAGKLDCSPSTVERKLRAIRSIWKSVEKRGP
ncbi:MAG: ECF-type sigma factor [Gemmataceae bacterium]